MFRKMKLSELGKVIAGGTPKTKLSEYWNGNIAWITPKDLSSFEGRFISNGDRNISEEGLKNSSAKLMPKGTVLFTSRAPIGYIAISENEVATNQGFKNIVVNQNNHNIFVYYLLKNNVDYIKSLANGSTFMEVSGSVMKNIQLNVPPLQMQKSIANILSTLDEKIEVNNQINKTLENMAQSIFKQWFVNFEFPNKYGEPYKSSGGKMIESEMGVIPEGWVTSSLDKIANYLNGLAMQKFRPNEDEKSYPVLKIKELRQGFSDSNSDVCSVNIDEKYIIKDGDVIFSWSGSLLIDFWCSGKCGLNQHLFKVTSDEFDSWFYYLWTEYHLEKFISIAKSKATTMGHIKRKDLSDSKIIIPDSNRYNMASEILKPIYDKIVKSKIESRSLIQIRDTLLPKLMSGEIRVPLDTDREIS